MTTKVSADMYPLNELREVFYKRVRTTAFVRHPDVFVSFKFFSCLMPMMPTASKPYAEVIEKALSGISFFTEEGFHRLDEVDYMFIDDKGLAVTVLNDGTPLTIKYPPESKRSGDVEVDSPLKFFLTTRYLKTYFIEHKAEFPHLNYLTDILNGIGIGNYTSYDQLMCLAGRCCEDSWITGNVCKFIDELNGLLDNASFVMDYNK